MITLDISYYTFTKEFLEQVQSFIDELNSFPKVEVFTNAVSTQVYGDFDDVMSAFKTTLKNHFQMFDDNAVVVKILNCDARIYSK